MIIAMLGGLLAPAAQDESENTTVERFQTPIVVQQQSEVTTEIVPPAPPRRGNSVFNIPKTSTPYEEATESNEVGYNLHEVDEVVGCTSPRCRKKDCDGCYKDACNRCGGRGCNYCCHRNRKRLRVKSSCNMPLHFAYFPDTHGYYYFQPYHHDHIARHIGLISIVGGDKRAPYSTEYFAKFYTDVLGVEAKRPQKLPVLGPTSEESNELPDLEELLKK